MQYASEDLRNEHEGILFGLQILEKMVQLTETKSDVPIEDFREMIHFLQLFADKCHHGKEEGLYFPALELAGVLRENGPIGQMLLEHDQGRQLISEMSVATAGVRRDADLIRASTDYIHLLRAHINKENTVLFLMGDRMIPAQKQAELLSSFETFEEEVMGSGTHDRLHKMLDAFESKYLG